MNAHDLGQAFRVVALIEQRAAKGELVAGGVMFRQEA